MEVGSAPSCRPPPLPSLSTSSAGTCRLPGGLVSAVPQLAFEAWLRALCSPISVQVTGPHLWVGSRRAQQLSPPSSHLNQRAALWWDISAPTSQSGDAVDSHLVCPGSQPSTQGAAASGSSPGSPPQRAPTSMPSTRVMLERAGCWVPPASSNVASLKPKFTGGRKCGCALAT